MERAFLIFVMRTSELVKREPPPKKSVRSAILELKRKVTRLVECLPGRRSARLFLRPTSWYHPSLGVSKFWAGTSDGASRTGKSEACSRPMKASRVEQQDPPVG